MLTPASELPVKNLMTANPTKLSQKALANPKIVVPM